MKSLNSEMDFSEAICDLTSARNNGRQVKISEGDIKAHGADRLVSRLSEAPRREIEDLIGKLMTLLEKLDTDGVRIQLDIENYAALNQRVTQLTTIVSDSVKEIPAPSVN
jgi:hypothetical protein